VHIVGIDYAAPVLAIQKQLAALRAQRIRSGPAFAISGCFVWVPLVLVAFHGLGADVWVHKPAVVGWFVASAFVAAGITWALLAWVRLPRNARTRQSWDDHDAGRGVTRAQAALDEIARFERE